jgi:hypothetical protein
MPREYTKLTIAKGPQLAMVAAMIKTFTLVKKKSGLSDAEFFDRWMQHTLKWDLADHPYISLNRLIVLGPDDPYTGMAENHWPDEASLVHAAGWYEKPEGKAHWADLCTFMDMANSPTVRVRGEAEVSAAKGIEVLLPLAAVPPIKG